MTREELTEEYGEELLFLDPAESFDKCIVGVVYRCSFEPVVCYDHERVISVLMEDGMGLEEAMEFFDFNISGAYVGPRTPMFLERTGATA